MIGETFATAQIQRLGGLDGFPREGFIGALAARAALKELVQALQCATTEALAKDVINSYFAIGATKDCPKPAEIRLAVNEREPAEEPEWLSQPKSVIRCPCDGWGTIGDPPRATFCTCSDGVDLARRLPDYLALVNARPLARSDGMGRPSMAWLFGTRKEPRGRARSDR